MLTGQFGGRGGGMLDCLRVEVRTQFQLQAQEPTDFYPLACTGTS